MRRLQTNVCSPKFLLREKMSFVVFETARK